MYKQGEIYKQSSTALIGESCIAVLGWFNSSYHWIPGIILDSRIWDPMLKITHHRLKKKEPNDSLINMYNLQLPLY